MITSYNAFRESLQSDDFQQLFGRRAEAVLTFQTNKGVVAPETVSGFLEKPLRGGRTHTKLVLSVNNGCVRRDELAGEVLDAADGSSRTQVTLNGLVVYDRTGKNHDLDDLLDVLRSCYARHLERLRVRITK